VARVLPDWDVLPAPAINVLPAPAINVLVYPHIERAWPPDDSDLMRTLTADDRAMP
jgi:hypothetical protein